MVKSSELITVTRLGRRIGGTWIWRNVDFALTCGERVALSGATGSGKSLWLRALIGIEPADEGKIAHRGAVPGRNAIPSFRTNVMYVPQTARFRPGTVADAVQRPFRFRANDQRHFEPDAVVNLLKQLGRTAGFLDKETDRLSGGENQIVGLVRALLLEPNVLLLDEPTAAMDSETARMAETVIDQWHNGKRALIWTSHDNDQLDRIATRTVRLSPNGLAQHDA